MSLAPLTARPIPNRCHQAAHREPPDLVPQICQWFGEAGFELVWLSGDAEPYGVGAHRFAGQPAPLAAGARMFTFLG